jgi:hypothetical protein
VLAGCSSDSEDEAPGACLSGSDEYLRALEAAPGEVRLEGETLISECLTDSQGGGELAQIGEEMIVAATVLNEQGRRDTAGPAPVRLGYLVGAAERGAEGIHADLIRRLNAAAVFSPDGEQLPGSFQAGYSQGFEAGNESG